MVLVVKKIETIESESILSWQHFAFFVTETQIHLITELYALGYAFEVMKVEHQSKCAKGLYNVFGSLTIF